MFKGSALYLYATVDYATVASLPTRRCHSAPPTGGVVGAATSGTGPTRLDNRTRPKGWLAPSLPHQQAPLYRWSPDSAGGHR